MVNLIKVSNKELKGAGFKSKSEAVSFMKNVLKKKGNDFKTVEALVNTIKTRSRPDIAKIEQDIKKGYEEIEDASFMFKFAPSPEKVLECANKFYNNIKFSVPRTFDYTNYKNEKKKTYNFAYNGSDAQIKDFLLNIYAQQKHTYKVNISFAFTLYCEDQIGKDTKISFRFFNASPNTRIFEHPSVIDNKADIDKLYTQILKENVRERLTDKRPGSKWIFYEYLYIRFDVYMMSSPIGTGQDLPEHFSQGSYKKALITYSSKEYHDDYLCFWRCLALHHKREILKEEVTDLRRIEKPVKELFNKFYNNNVILKDYEGIQYVAYDKEYTSERLDAEDYDQKRDEIDDVERCFKININVFTNDELDVFQIDRRSMSNHETTLNLLRYNNHFMYIKDMDQIRHCYKCRKCGLKTLKNFKACQRHEQTCNEGLIKHVFPGGDYSAGDTIFSRIFKLYKSDNYLEYFDITENDLFYPFEAVYDFEAMLKKLEIIDNDKKLKITTEHVPVSVSILSNVPGYSDTPIFIVNESPEILINSFVENLYQISLKAKSILSKKYSKILVFLNDKINQQKNEEQREKMEGILKQFIAWLSAMQVLSFNGSKYDINLMKHYLHKSLDYFNETVSFSIKKANSYMALSIEHFKFLDIRSYLAPNYSYDAFVKAYKCKLEKGFFPYDWFDSYD